MKVSFIELFKKELYSIRKMEKMFNPVLLYRDQLI